MPEYRVMHIGMVYQIQQKTRKGWESVGEFDNIKSAKMMVRELRGNSDEKKKRN